MKIILGVLVSFFAVNTFASEQVLQLKTHANGTPNFGIQYAYDISSVFAFTYSTTISNEAVSALPSRMVWGVVNATTNQPLAPWSEIGRNELVGGSISLSGKTALAAVLPNLKSSKVAFGVQNQQGGIDILFSIAIGPLCESYPGQIRDLTHPSKQACEVSANDIPDSLNACQKLETTFKNYLKKGYMTCEIAKTQYANRSCGVLQCE